MNIMVRILFTLMFLRAIKKAQSSLALTRGDLDIVDGIKCEGKNINDINSFGCVCKSDHDTFYDHDGKYCYNLSTIVNIEGCEKLAMAEFIATFSTCALDKESVTAQIRDRNGDESFWNENYSDRFLKDLVTVEDDRITLRTTKEKPHSRGLLLKLTYECLNDDSKCAIIKTEGEQTYPYVWEEPPTTTTTTTTITTTKPTATPTTTRLKTQPFSTTSSTTPLPESPSTLSTTSKTFPKKSPVIPSRSSITPSRSLDNVLPSSSSIQTNGTTKQKPNAGLSKDDNGGNSNIAIIAAVVAVGIVLIASLVIFLVLLKMKKKKESPYSYPSNNSQVYTNHHESSHKSADKTDRTDNNRNSLPAPIDDIQDTSPHYEGIGNNELENYSPLESAFSNEAYTGLDETDPKYYELETPKKEEPVYNILEKEEDDTLYQDPNGYEINKPPVVPPRGQSSSAVNSQNVEEPYQEGYYSAALSPETNQLDINALYAPVNKPMRK